MFFAQLFIWTWIEFRAEKEMSQDILLFWEVGLAGNAGIQLPPNNVYDSGKLARAALL